MAGIAFVTGSLPPMRCGVGHYSATLLPFLRRRRPVAVIGPPDPTAPPEGADSGPCEAPDRAADSSPGRARWRLRALPRLLRDVRATAPGAVVLQYPAKGYGHGLGVNLFPLCWRLGFGVRRRRVPLVVTLHEWHGAGVLGKARTLTTLLGADAIVVSNEFDLAGLPRWFRRRARIIPIGSMIPVGRRRPEVLGGLAAAQRAELRPPVGVFFGFAGPDKGLDVVLDAVGSLGASLVIASDLDGPDAAPGLADRVAAARQAGAAVVVTGYLDDDDVSAVLHECDYFVNGLALPITGKATTALAAAAHGLGIVSTAGADPRMNLPFVAGTNAVLIVPRSAATLAGAILGLGDASELARLRAGALALASSLEWERIADAHLALLDERGRRAAGAS